jgi:hypothetical protein
MAARLLSGVSVEFVRWRQKAGGDKLHNRYVLTDIGGVSLGVGLDEGQRARPTICSSFLANSTSAAGRSTSERTTPSTASIGPRPLSVRGCGEVEPIGRLGRSDSVCKRYSRRSPSNSDRN